MPIEGLTNPEKTFLLLGRLKKGAVEKKGEKSRPVDLDYWRAVFLPSRDSERIEQCFRATYGNEPKDINIRLAFDTIDNNWDANFECYKRGALVAKAAQTAARGTYWLYYRDPETSEVLVRHGAAVGEKGFQFMQRPIDLTQPVYLAKESKAPAFLEPLGRLRVVIPEIAMMDPPVIGFFEVQLKSPNDIRQVSAELDGIAHMAAQSNAKISGIPMRLSRMEEDITKNINGNLTRGKSWMVHISLHGEWANKALQYMERMALPEIIDGVVTDVPMLESGEDWEDQEPVFAQPEPEPEPEPKTPVKKVVRYNKDDTQLLELLVKNGLFDNVISAGKVMDKCAWKTQPYDKFAAWAQVYRDWKGLLLAEEVTPVDATTLAIDNANAGKRVGQE